MNSGKAKIFNQSFLEIALINFLVLITFYSLIVAIGPYAVDVLHLSTAVSGLLVGIVVIGSLVMRMMSGAILAKISTKTMMLIGAFVLIPTMVAYHFATSMIVLLLIRFIQGMMIGLIGTVTNTAVVFVVPAERRSEGISYFSLSTVIATAMGPFLGLALSKIGYGFLFNIETVIAVLAFLATILIHKEAVDIKAHTVKKVETADKPTGLKKFLEPKAVPLAIALFIATLTYSAIQSYLSFFMKAQHMASVTEYFFLIYAAVIFISRPFTGRLADEKNENYIIYPGLILLAIGFVLLSHVTNVWVFVLAAIFIGVGFGNFQSAAQATIAKIVPPERMSYATSTYFIFFDLAFGVGPYLLGLIEPSIGFVGLYELMIAFAIIALVWYFLVHGRHVKR